MNPNIRIGVEMELTTNVDQSGLVYALRDKGLAACDADRTHNPTGQWGVKSDGSISRGWEVVSPIMTPADLYEMLPKVGEAFAGLRRMGYALGADRTCGVHVHLSGIGETDVDKLRAICRGAMIFEEQLDLLQPASRRDNSYCKSNLARFGRSRWDPENGRWLAAPTLRETLDNMWAQTAACRSTDALYATVCDDRYFKLNLDALDRHGTIEFRQHAGTANVQKVVRWVEFLAHFCDVRANALRAHNRTRRPETQAQRFRKMGRGVPADVMRYLRTRARTINGADVLQRPAQLAA